jgi:hypothetical protein
MSNLRKNDTITYNPTNRIDLKPRDFLFEVSREERGLRVRITVKDWEAISEKIAPHHELSITLTRGKTPLRRMDVGRAKAAMRGGVIIKDIETDFEAESIGVIVHISNPSDSHLTVLRAVKGKPDSTDADIPEPNEAAETPVRPIRQAAGKENGLLNVYEDPRVSGAWDVLLEDVDVPQLVVLPEIGKARVASDPLVQNAILPEVFRRVVTAMVKEKDRYEGAPWFREWQAFVISVADIDSWADFDASSQDAALGDVDDMIRDAVTRYRTKFLPELSRFVADDDNSNED